MFKNVGSRVWVFDVEWVPNPAVGRAVYGLPSNMPVRDVLDVMWKEGGATPSEPRPYLKTVLCRVVSIASVTRTVGPDGAVRLGLHSTPDVGEGTLDEAVIVQRFLQAVGEKKPQLVGFNSNGADLTILVQRGVALGLQAAEFCERPDKPWGGVDYFARYGDSSIDLLQVFTGSGKATWPKLHEIAVSCGIPGKLDADGRHVADLWLEGDIRRIVQYNQCDALTTYLLWLRAAHFGGFLSGEEFAAEERQLRHLLEAQAATPGNGHLRAFLDRWSELAAVPV